MAAWAPWAGGEASGLRSRRANPRFSREDEMLDPQNKTMIADLVLANYLYNWTFDVQEARALVQRYAGPVLRTEWKRDFPFECNVTAVETLSTLFLFCGGIADQTGRERIINGWGDRAFTLAAHGFNPWASDIFDLRVAPMVNFSSWDNRQVVYIGQSAGGLLSEMASFKMFGRADRPNDLSILTGTPRGLNFDGDGFYSTGSFYRFMVVNDPVVSLPPRFPEWPEMCLLFSAIDLPYTIAKILGASGAGGGNYVFDFWPLWHHPPGGIVLNDSGYAFASNDLPPPRSAGLVGLSASQTVHNLFSYQAHEMMTYVNAVRQWSILNSLLEKPVLPESPGEASGGNWGRGIEFFCPADDAGNIVFSPNGRVRPVSNKIGRASCRERV